MGTFLDKPNKLSQLKIQVAQTNQRGAIQETCVKVLFFSFNPFYKNLQSIYHRAHQVSTTSVTLHCYYMGQSHD